MRIALALVLFALPAVGLPLAAQASDRGEGRYGPPPPHHSAAVSYPTPASAAKDEAAASDEAASYCGPDLSWSGKGGARQPAPPAMLPRRTQMAVSSPDMPRAPFLAQTSLTPPPTAVAHTPVAVATKAAPTSTPAAAPTQAATATPQPQPPAAPVKARFYALHGDYGGAPDPVTLPRARPPVLAGPAETATASQSSNSDDHGEGGSDRPKPLSGALY